MFTGIIETLGNVQNIEHEGDNVHFTLRSSISHELKIDQSVAHNGVCLTVVALQNDSYTVTAVQETLRRTNLGAWKIGDSVNLERAMVAHARLDGHMVQGHVDTTGVVTDIREQNGSWEFSFQYPAAYRHLLVNKGSVCINGVSLTVVEPHDAIFSVAIIPYTYAHTTFQYFKIGDAVNLEFDIIGKYIAQYASLYFNK